MTLNSRMPETPICSVQRKTLPNPKNKVDLKNKRTNLSFWNVVNWNIFLRNQIYYCSTLDCLKKREIVFLLLLCLVLLFGDDETIATWQNLLSVKPLPVVTDPGVITKPACSTTVTQISSEWTVTFPQLGTFIPCKALLL